MGIQKAVKVKDDFPEDVHVIMENIRKQLKLLTVYEPKTSIAYFNKVMGMAQKQKHLKSCMLYPNHGRHWTPEDDAKLLEMYSIAGTSIIDMAKEVGRTLKATKWQLSGLLIKETKASSYEAVAQKYNRTLEEIKNDIDTLHNV